MSEIWSNIKRELLGLKWVGNTTCNLQIIITPSAPYPTKPGKRPWERVNEVAPYRLLILERFVRWGNEVESCSSLNYLEIGHFPCNLYSILDQNCRPHPSFRFWVIFCKKIPLSRRVEYIMDGSTDQWVSESVSERWMYFAPNQIGSTINSQSNFLF